MTITFALKSAAYLVAPSMFPRVRAARAAARSAWKAPVPKDSGEYTAYVAHQAEKYDGVLAQGGFSGRDIVRFRRQFRRRFQIAIPYLKPGAKILCTGAREGSEVEVWRDLGFPESFGIDLNPGPGNPFVKPGDFHNLPFGGATFDLYYCNAIDHSPEPAKLFTEAARVLKPGGLALLDIAQSNKAGNFEATTWESPEHVAVAASRIIGQEIARSIPDKKWLTVLLRRP